MVIIAWTQNRTNPKLTFVDSPFYFALRIIDYPIVKHETKVQERFEGLAKLLIISFPPIL